MKKEVRALEKKDIEKASDLFYEIYTNIPYRFEWLKKENVVRYFNDNFSRNSFLGYVLVIDDKDVGYCFGNIKDYFKNSYYEIDEIYVNRVMQGEGHGTYFLNTIEDFVSKKNVNVIKLNANQNSNNFKFYSKNKFVKLKDNISLIKRIDSY